MSGRYKNQRDFARIAPNNNGTAVSWALLAAVVGVMCILGLVAFVLRFTDNAGGTGIVKTVSGVSPTNGELTLVAGTSMVLTPDLPSSTVTVVNDGVRTATGGAGIAVSAAKGDVTFTNDGVRGAFGGLGISVSSTKGDVTFTNDGATSVSGTDGIATDATTGAVTASHVLTTQTLLPFGDPMGPQVSYLHLTGFIVPHAQNTWRMGVFPIGFPECFFCAGTGQPVFLPGSVPGDGGQGDATFGLQWFVPAPGLYDFHVQCAVFPSAIAPNEHQSVTVALNLGASTSDPTISGFIPIGGRQTRDISQGTAADIGAFARRVSFSASVHAGCPGCPVSVGDQATLHFFQDTSAVGPITMAAGCLLQVNRIM